MLSDLKGETKADEAKEEEPEKGETKADETKEEPDKGETKSDEAKEEEIEKAVTEANEAVEEEVMESGEKEHEVTEGEVKQEDTERKKAKQPALEILVRQSYPQKIKNSQLYTTVASHIEQEVSRVITGQGTVIKYMMDGSTWVCSVELIGSSLCMGLLLNLCLSADIEKYPVYRCRS